MKSIFPKKDEQRLDARAALGAAGENASADFLMKKGYRVLERNYRVKGGEIDLIAEDREEIVFVEVKTRRSIAYGYPEESVSFAKELRMARAMRHFLCRFRQEPAYRVDIVSVVYPSGASPQPEIHHMPSILLRIQI